MTTGSPVSLVCTPGLGGSRSRCQRPEQSSLSSGRSELHFLEERSQVGTVGATKCIVPRLLPSFLSHTVQKAGEEPGNEAMYTFPSRGLEYIMPVRGSLLPRLSSPDLYLTSLEKN